MRLPPLSALRAFEAAARHQSFSAAGNELCVTHAAVSHQIRNLEDWFGTRLFEREGRGVRLTRAGEVLFGQIATVFADIAAACSRVKALGGRQSLSVGCIPSIASRWLVPNLNAFVAVNPGLEVRVVYATADEKLAGSDLDVLITTGTEEAPDILSSHLFSRVTRPVCSPGFLDAHGPLDTPRRIAAAPLLHDETRSGWQAWFGAAGMAWQEPVHWPVFQDSNMLATAAIAGHGVALCPVEVFALEVERGDLVVLSELSLLENGAYVARYRRSSGGAAAAFVRWFGDLATATGRRTAAR